MTRRADLDTAREKLAQASDLLRAAQRVQDGAASALESAVEGAVKDGFYALSTAPGPVCLHTRDHRPGRPSKIETDPELNRFVLARIDHMGFVDLAKQIADHFPPARRVGKSALHAWFRKYNPKSHPR